MKGNVMTMSAKAVEQIFAPQRLGIVDKIRAWAESDDFLATSGLGAVEYPRCEFSYRGVEEATRQLQELLRQRGATSLKADGIWGACTDSAFQGVFGEPLTKESLQRLLGVTCKEFYKKVDGRCTNGSDAISAPPPVPPTTTTSPPMLSLLKLQLTPTRTVNRNLLNLQRIPSPADTTTLTPGDGQQVIAKASTVPGVPDWALGVGLVAVVAGVALYLKKRA